MFNIEDIQALSNILKENNLAKIKIKDHRGELCIENQGQMLDQDTIAPLVSATSMPLTTGVTPIQTNASNEPDVAKADFYEVLSPMIGTLYMAPDPSSPDFVEVGSHVSEDSVICLLEAMKLYTEVEAGVDGVIAEILVNNGDFIEHGQPLFRIKY